MDVQDVVNAANALPYEQRRAIYELLRALAPDTPSWVAVTLDLDGVIGTVYGPYATEAAARGRLEALRKEHREMCPDAEDDDMPGEVHELQL